MGSEQLEDLQLRLPPGKDGPDLLNVVAESYDLDRLFKFLLRSESARRMLFLSKHDLFQLEDEHQIPLFHACRADDDVGEILSALVEESGYSPTDMASILDEGLGPSGGLVGLLDAFGYAIFAAGIADPELHESLVSGEFTFARWRKMVRDAGGIDNLLTRLAQASQSQTNENEAYQSFVAQRTTELARIAAERMDRLAVAARQAIPDIVVQLHGAGTVWINHMNSVADLSIDEVEEVLGGLVKLDVVETKSALAWCPSCQLERPAYQILAGTWAPKRYATHSCFVCKGAVNYAAIMYPEGDFRDALLSRDGLLACFVAWRLMETSRLDKAFFQAGGRECDFLTTRGNLLEIKMFQTSRDRGSLRRSLGEASNQLKKTIPALREDIHGLKQVFLVTNLPDDIVEAFNAKRHAVDGVTIIAVGLGGIQDI